MHIDDDGGNDYHHYLAIRLQSSFPESPVIPCSLEESPAYEICADADESDICIQEEKGSQ